MERIKNTCFVCKDTLRSGESSLNTTVNMPVCEGCKATAQEKEMEKEVLDSLADGLVCGCI